MYNFVHFTLVKIKNLIRTRTIGMYAVDTRPNCGLASALCLRMLPRCPGWAWLIKSCLARTVVGWLVPMVWSWVRAGARAERHYRLLSCPDSAAAVAAVEQLGTALAAEQLMQLMQLMQPTAEGAARQPTAAAAAMRGSNSFSGNSSTCKQRSSCTGSPQQQL